MANSFLPLGYQPQSEEEIKMTEEKEKLYEYYGIPYGVIDGSKEDENNLCPSLSNLTFLTKSE